MSEINNPVNVSYVDEREALQVKYVECMLPNLYKVDYSISGFSFTHLQNTIVASTAYNIKVSDIGNLVKLKLNIKYGDSYLVEDYIVSGVVKQSSTSSSILYCGAIYDISTGEILEGEPLNDTFVKGVSVCDSGLLAPLSIYLDPTIQVSDVEVTEVEYLSYDEASSVADNAQLKLFDSFTIRLSSASKIVSMSVYHAFSRNTDYNDRRASELVLNNNAPIYIRNTSLSMYYADTGTTDAGRVVSTTVFENYTDVSFGSLFISTGVKPINDLAVIPSGFSIVSRGNVDDLTISVVEFSTD